MSQYTPPNADMMFVLNDVLGFKSDIVDAETLEAVLEEAAKLATGVLAPLNWSGDQDGTKLDDGVVTTAKGFKEAYAQYRDGGWNAVPFSEDYGGQGLPYGVAFPVQEMWQGANMSFGLCPLLNQGAVEAIYHHGSQEQKDEYLEKLISGEWTGTMNLTEPQAGSDLGLLRAKAEPQDDGTYKISGQKIYITYGEHDMAENIIHLVLARLPDAPDDVRGISLFLVPKILADGTRNDVKCTGIEHKLGIHASPTCTMQFGDNGGAVGYLLGEAHHGLKYMFTMMNNARLSVGLQGVAIAEASYQHALNYAEERVQGKDFETGERVSIRAHADVQRMLLTMRSQIEAGRALTYEAALALDAGDDATVGLLTPIVKSWCTDMACAVTSIGVQVHGGMYIEVMKQRAAGHDDVFAPHFEALDKAMAYLFSQGEAKAMDNVAAASTPFLNGLGVLAGGCLMAASLKAADNHADSDFGADKKRSCEFFLSNILPYALAHFTVAVQGNKFAA